MYSSRGVVFLLAKQDRSMGIIIVLNPNYDFMEASYFLILIVVWEVQISSG